MNKASKKFMAGLGSLLLLLVIVFCSVPTVAKAAEEEEKAAQVLVTEYKSSAQPVVPGEDFTLTISLKNFDKVSAAENVMVVLNCPSGVALQYGTVSVAHIDSINAGGTATVVFKLTVNPDLLVSNLNFNVGVTGGIFSSNTQISLPVSEQPEIPEIGIIGYEVSKSPIVPGDEVTLTLEVKNFSKKIASENISVILSNPAGIIPEYGTVNTERIESIAPDTTEKVSFTFTATSDLSSNELYFTATACNHESSSSAQFSIPIKKIVQLYIEGYEVTNTTIVPGNDFDLKVLIKNPSEDITVEDIIVSITNPAGVVPEYGKVGIAVIDSIAPGGTGEVYFRYSSDSSIKTTELNFSVGAFYGSMSTSAQIRIPVGRMTDLTVEKASMPEKMTVGKMGYASAQIENLDDTEVSNVVMIARCSGKEIASANIGTISAKTYKTQSLSFMFDKEGQYAVDLVLTYKNGKGESKEYMISSGIVQVAKEEEVVESIGDNQVDISQNQEYDDNSEPEGGIDNILLLCVSGVLLIALGCVILIVLYRRK